MDEIKVRTGRKKAWRGMQLGMAWALMSNFLIGNLIADYRGKEAHLKAISDSWYDCPWQLWAALWVLTLALLGMLMHRLLRRPTVTATVTIRGPVTAKALEAGMMRAVQVVDTTIQDLN